MDDRRFEDSLRERFERLRAEDAGGAPELVPMLRGARRPADAGADGAPPAAWRRPRWWAAAVTLAAAVFAGIMLGAPDPDREFERLVASYSADLGRSGWRSPTDPLLEVPGGDLLGRVPSIGVSGSLVGDLVDPGREREEG